MTEIKEGANRPITYREFSRRINDSKIIEDRADWAGLAVPIEGARLVLEPRYPYQSLATFWEDVKREEEGKPTIADEEAEEEKKWNIVNTWWSERLNCEIMIMREVATGKLEWLNRKTSGGTMIMNTMLCSLAWPLEAERKALDKLAEMITNHAFISYLLTGSFLETSKRSGITYMFRKLRPTLAIKKGEEGSQVLCGLCLHPIGYYSESWAGVMVPTDEVVAHLCLMRGAEEKYWANANQHHPSHPACGLGV